MERGQRWYRVYSARSAGVTLLVCYGSWRLVQDLMKAVSGIARGLGKGTGFSVEAVDKGKQFGITEEQRRLLASWTY